jgi:CDP-glycerol glycerophosphotransferase (TagB/SpsB family)
VPVGRPQLDLHPEPVLPPTSRRTILYAPTWEGENESNNYTSVDVFGPAIVAAALAVPDVRVVYKPHPRVVTSPTPAIAAAHERIVQMLSAEPHRVIENGDILAVLPGCDLMITDVSSVGLDFLYLETAKPLFVTDRRGDRERLHADAPVSRCADIVDAGSLPVLAHRLGQRLAADLHRPGREELRRHYFGDLLPGESTERFVSAIDEVIAARDRGLRRLEQVVYAGTEASGA